MSTRGRDGRHASGTTLIEALVVLVVGILVILVAASAVAWWTSRGSTAQVVDAYAGDLRQFSRAATTWINGNSGSIPLGAVSGPITVAGLRTLPGGFARYGGVVGRTPLHQSYAAFAMRPAENERPQIVITEAGATSGPVIERLRVNASADGILALKELVGARARSPGDWHVAIIASGSTVAAGLQGGWTKDVAAWVGGPAVGPRLAVLVGFPDLDGSAPPSEQPIPVGNCTVRRPTSVNLAACEVGEVEAARWPFCGRMNTTHHPQYDVYPSAVGQVTVGERTRSVPVPPSEVFLPPVRCSQWLSGSGYCPGQYVNYHRDTVILINDSEVMGDLDCETEIWWGSDRRPWTMPCMSDPQNNSSSYLGACRVETKHPLLQLWGGSAEDVLCCTNP